MTERSWRGRYEGVLQILRFNRPMYVTGLLVLGAGAVGVVALPLPNIIRTAALAGIALAAFWLFASVAVSHYVYDLSGLHWGHWLNHALGHPPRHAVNLHAGLDEFSALLRTRFPEMELRVLDFFDARRMTEPSIARARELARNQLPAERVDFRSLPLRDAEVDTAFLIFAAHELRDSESRSALLRELNRSLTSDGQLILVEHLRDLLNFLAFGPGFLHFHSRATWQRDATSAGFSTTKEFRLTPFVRVFRLAKAGQ